MLIAATVGIAQKTQNSDLVYYILCCFMQAIPSAWLATHLPIKGNQDVILRFKDRAWHTRFFYHKSRNNGGLTGGWKKFALDNNLHEFDVCVFEPLDLVNYPIILNVSIFRVVEEVSPITSQDDEKKSQGHA